MARIRITNGVLPGHVRKSLDALGTREAGAAGGRSGVVNEAAATLLNMQSRAITATPEEQFIDFMYANIGQPRSVANGRMFEGMQNHLNIQAGRGSFRTVPTPGVAEFVEYLDASMITPNHNSPTPLDTHAGVVSASSEYDQSNYGAWRAVNNNTGDYEWATAANPSMPCWWKYDFRLPVYVRRYAIGSGNNTTYQPKSWQFQGSHDNTNWTTLDTQSNVTSWVSGEYKSYTLAADAFFRYFRLLISAGNNATYVYMSEIKIFSLPGTYDGGPTLWTPFTDTVASNQLRVGCIISSAYAAPVNLGAALVSGGFNSWYPATGVSLKATRAAGKAYVGTVTIGLPATEHPIRVISPQNSWWAVKCLAAERIS